MEDRILSRPSVAWLSQDRRFPLWIPAMLGVGIWLGYFGLPGKPLLSVSVLLVLIALSAFLSRGKRRVIAALLAIITGLLAAEIRVRDVDAPVLSAPYRGTIEGRVIGADRSRSGAPRLLLDEILMGGPDVPARVRLTLISADAAPEIGARVSLDATLDAPPGPPEPGAFDFSMQAYFDRIGAVGYARGQPEIVDRAANLPFALRVDRFRSNIAAEVEARIGGAAGGVAAALMVGDRSAIPEDTRQALRDSGLAHLLAISGLHVGLLSALVFWSVRLVLALIPGLAERRPIRKYAAVAGLLGAGIYLILSGASVTTQRAFVMAGVAFCAILIDRAPITMRGLAAAAILILLMRPESLFEAGFQMSFGAVAALVASYEATRGFWRKRAQMTDWRARFVTFALATLMTSVVAGIATAPFAAYHFNRIVVWGLPANLLATPLMGVWIMPCVILAGLLAPFGLADLALKPLGVGIDYIIYVASWFGGLEDAVTGVAAGTPLALSLIVFGGLWLTIWRGAVRFVGVIFAFSGIYLWMQTERPALIIAQKAALISGIGEDGRRWVSRPRAETYAAEMWLRRDGMRDADRSAAYARREWRCTSRRCTGWTTGADGDWRVIFLRKGDAQPQDCPDRTILIATSALTPRGDCTVIDAETLHKASGIAVHLPDDAPPALHIARGWVSRR